MSLLNFHALAAQRGEGLRPELRALLERASIAPHPEPAARGDGMVQSGSDPVSPEDRAKNERCTPDVVVIPWRRWRS
jgi:hypothetical protein